MKALYFQNTPLDSIKSIASSSKPCIIVNVKQVMQEKCLLFPVRAEVMRRLHHVQLQHQFDTMRTPAPSQTKGLTPFLTVTSSRSIGKVPKEESEIRAILWDCAIPGVGSQ